MPIGSSKLGVLGAGLVPGGSVTFNTSGNWSVPPGVKKVSITGKGATGNPGNAGNPGNPGNIGSGGSGGGGASSFKTGGRGGLSYYGGLPCSPSGIPINSAPPNAKLGGAAASSGQTGFSGNSGQGGQAGQAGNPGQASSGLGNTFPGGAGGNAGNAGNAGTGGSGGGGGGGGGGAGPNAQPGSGGSSGGGAGGTLSLTVAQLLGPPYNAPDANQYLGAIGGGGAGTINDGNPGSTNYGLQVLNISGNKSICLSAQTASNGLGGTCNQSILRSGNPGNFNFCNGQISTPEQGQVSVPYGGRNRAGGHGGIGRTVPGCPQPGLSVLSISSVSCPANPFGSRSTPMPGPAPTQITNDPLWPSLTSTCNPRNPYFRSGGGGGASSNAPSSFPPGGGGGGGGRGNAGNAGGAGGAGGTGATANPSTFNCVTVTPGATVPITVASPGGQIVISWNPQ